MMNRVFNFFVYILVAARFDITVKYVYKINEHNFKVNIFDYTRYTDIKEKK